MIWVGDEEEGGTGGADIISVINIVDAHRLQEIELEKKAFMGYIKGLLFLPNLFLEYLKKVKAKLEE